MSKKFKKGDKTCPFCGDDLALYSIETVSYPQYYTLDGEPDGYGEFSQIGSSNRRKTTPLYCINCEKRITTLEELLKEGDA